MILIQTSISAAGMIILVLVIRKLMFNWLPKNTFWILWCIVLVRLLILYSIPLGIFLPLVNSSPAALSSLSNTLSQSASKESTILFIIWGTGFFIFGLVFTLQYYHHYKQFQRAKRLKSQTIDEWLSNHSLKRKISIKSSKDILTPLTYGIFLPVILLPEDKDISDEHLPFVLEHEYVHICRFDALFKIILAFGLCIHWFNPFVWIMAHYFNCDVELSCDETVINHFGREMRSAYAMSLISMQENDKNHHSLATSEFSKLFLEERIVSIMSIKKWTALCIFAVGLIIALTTSFFFNPFARSRIVLASSAESEIDQLLKPYQEILDKFNIDTGASLIIPEDKKASVYQAYKDMSPEEFEQVIRDEYYDFQLGTSTWIDGLDEMEVDIFNK